MTEKVGRNQRMKLPQFEIFLTTCNEVFQFPLKGNRRLILKNDTGFADEIYGNGQ
jgi:hypothetical protein